MLTISYLILACRGFIGHEHNEYRASQVDLDRNMVSPILDIVKCVALLRVVAGLLVYNI